MHNVSCVCVDVPMASVANDVVWAWQGQSRQLTCVAQASPPPTISWLRGGATGAFIDDNEVYTISSWRDGNTLTSNLTVSIISLYD